MSKPKYTNLLSEKQAFKNQTFEKNIFEIDFETDNDISFINCIFKGIASFENINAREVSFIECTFENVLSISKSSFFTFGFSNCKLMEDSSFKSNICSSYAIFRSLIGGKLEISGSYQNFQVVTSKIERLRLIHVNSEYSERNSKIEFLVGNKLKELEIKSHSNFSNIIFKGGEYESIYFYGTFNNSISFDKKIKNEYLFFESAIFKSRIDFNEGKFKYINLYRSSFHGLVMFNGFNYLDNLEKDISIKNLTIHSSYFEKDVRVSVLKINSLNLSNNNFKQILNINNHNSNDNNLQYSHAKIISLTGSNLGNIIIENIFADITISDFNFGNIYFKNIDLHTLYINQFHNKGNISFTNIHSGIYLVIQDSIMGNFNLLNEDLNMFNELIIANSNLKGIEISIYPKKIRSFSSNPKIGYGIKNKSKNNQNLKNVYNQLKQIAKSNGDIDPMNKYKSLELRKLNKTKRISFDSILLLLNWVSNNNGQSWFRGVLFTLIVAFLFFLLYLNNLGVPININEHYKDYISFISSFPKLQLEKYSELNKLWNVSLVIWLSRVFVSYGVYQTISAFRKYGKD
ncbi:hypothetical protein [Joostella sp.]|uniref:hypothetical protein n=1 Tax=Joostella sp. TaxID=2231138 RepID=UPI003A951698